MMRHRVITPLLYAQCAPARWLRAAQSAAEDTAGVLYRDLWQRSPVPVAVLRAARPIPPGRFRVSEHSRPD